MAAYPSPIVIEQTSRLNNTVRSINTDFGDGYQSRTPDGINYIVRNGVMTHRFIPKDDSARTVGADTLRAFLRSYVGTNNTVQIPNVFEDPTGSTTLDVYLDSWSETYTGELFTFTVQFREAFNV